MSDTTKTKFIEFLEHAANKGFAAASLVSSWKAGGSAALEDISGEADVCSVDVELELLKYNNRNPGKVKPDTLRRYKTWALAGIANFKKYADDPIQYRPIKKVLKGNQPKNSSKKNRVDPTTLDSISTNNTNNLKDIAQNQQISSLNKSNGIATTYPLRPDFRVQVVLPEDMTTIEAKRLARFIMSYAQDLPTD